MILRLADCIEGRGVRDRVVVGRGRERDLRNEGSGDGKLGFEEGKVGRRKKRRVGERGK